MKVGFYVAHAAWAPDRDKSLQALQAHLPHFHTVLASKVPEHASVWAQRLWRAALEGDATHAVFLNDDVTVAPNFRDACAAITRAVPDEVIALHTMRNPAVRGPWQRAYWLTGPGYIIPRSHLASLLSFATEWHELAAAANEDNVIMQWSWDRQRPVWHCIPALVDHDVSVPSTLGYDNHPNRKTNCAWHTMPGVDITDRDYWGMTGMPPLVECPWMPTIKLRAIQGRRGRPPVCFGCSRAPQGMLEFMNGAAICRPCLASAAAKARFTCTKFD